MPGAIHARVPNGTAPDCIARETRAGFAWVRYSRLVKNARGGCAMSDEPIQQVPRGMITLGCEKPPLRMAVQYREPRHVPLTKADLSPAENGLRGSGFGAYAIEPALYQYKFANTIPLGEENTKTQDAPPDAPLAKGPAWPSRDR